MKRTILKDTLILVAITLAAAFFLALVNQITKDPIARAEAEERMASFYEVFPGAADFEEIGEERILAWNEAHPDGEILQGFYAKAADGTVLGAALSVTSRKGYSGDLTLSVGVKPDGALTGVKVTKMSESPGLGAKCQDESWAAGFAGKVPNADGEIGLTKNGDPGESEIDCISGATRTTNAVLDAVNRGIAFAENCLGKEAAVK